MNAFFYFLTLASSFTLFLASLVTFAQGKPLNAVYLLLLTYGIEKNVDYWEERWRTQTLRR